MQKIAKSKKRLSFFIRSLVSIGLIYYVFHRVSLHVLFQTFKEANIHYLILSFCITPVLIFISSWKWKVILKALKIHVSIFKLFWLYVVGYFFNTVLPTNVGGDVVRAYSLGKSTNQNAKAFSSVFIERFTGLTALLFMAILAFFIAIRNFWDLKLSIALILCLVGYIFILFFLLNKSIIRRIQKVPIRFLKVIFNKVLKFQEAILSLRHEKAALVFAIFNSFLFYFVAVLNVYVSSLAFNASLSFFDALLITPIVLVITMIPISIGGIGLAEYAYFFTFTRLELVGAVGLSVALFMRAKALVAGLIGGIYYSSMGIKIEQDELPQSSHKMVSKGDVDSKVDYFSGFEDVMRRKKSPLQKYQDIVMGNKSLPKLIKFELITFCCAYIPGIVGYGLRKIFYPMLFGQLGKGSVLGKSVTLRHVHKINVGKRCVIDEYCSLSAQGDQNSHIAIGDEVLLGRSTVVSTRNGQIKIGDFSNIGSNCRMGTTSKIIIGKHVLFAANCYVGGAQHKFDRTDIPIMRQGYQSKGGVVIEDDVWLGAGVMVLDGVRIGTGCVIGAGSVVTKDLEPYSIALGAPARITASRKPSQAV